MPADVNLEAFLKELLQEGEEESARELIANLSPANHADQGAIQERFPECPSSRRNHACATDFSRPVQVCGFSTKPNQEQPSRCLWFLHTSGSHPNRCRGSACHRI